jgi:hypothetical protein
MARRKSVNETEDPVFVNELPNIGGGAAWTSILSPLITRPEQWALIREFDTPTQAMASQSNLARRKVNIPLPDHEWSFAARGAELYACYRGKKKKQRSSSARIRRT